MQRLGGLSADDVRARRTVTRRDREDGMVAIEAVLPPDEAAVVWAAIEHESALASGASGASGASASGANGANGASGANGATGASAVGVSAEARPAVARVDGLVAMCQAALRGDAPERAPVEVVLTIARDALAGTARDPAAPGPAPGSGDRGRDGAPARVRLRRRDADGGRGGSAAVGGPAHALDPGGDQPGAGPARRNLSVPRLHQPPLPRGPSPDALDPRRATALENLCRLCPSHHRFVHEHGYRVELREGEPVFFHRGRQVHAEPPRVAGGGHAIDSARAWAAIRAREEAHAIDATTGLCAWDGEPVDNAWVVDGLVRMAASERAEGRASSG